MGKKSGQFFFDKFSQAASISCEAAQAVYTFLKDYDPDQVEKRVAELHEIEHRGDENSDPPHGAPTRTGSRSGRRRT